MMACCDGGKRTSIKFRLSKEDVTKETLDKEDMAWQKRIKNVGVVIKNKAINIKDTMVVQDKERGNQYLFHLIKRLSLKKFMTWKMRFFRM